MGWAGWKPTNVQQSLSCHLGARIVLQQLILVCFARSCADKQIFTAQILANLLNTHVILNSEMNPKWLLRSRNIYGSWQILINTILQQIHKIFAVPVYRGCWKILIPWIFVSLIHFHILYLTVSELICHIWSLFFLASCLAVYMAASWLRLNLLSDLLLQEKLFSI